MDRGRIETTRDPDDVEDDEAAGPKKEGNAATHLQNLIKSAVFLKICTQN